MLRLVTPLLFALLALGALAAAMDEAARRDAAGVGFVRAVSGQ